MVIPSLSPRASQGLVGSAVVYMLAAALNAMIPFMLLPFIARWLGPADFGIIGSFVAIVNVLILVIGLNAYGFVGVGYYRDGSARLPQLVGAAVLIVASAAAVTGFAIWLGVEPIERLTGVEREWAWTLAVAAAGQAVIAIGLTVAQTIQRPAVYGAIQISYGLTLAILAVLLVGALGMGWPGRALAQAGAAVAVAGGALLWLRSSGRITLTVGRDMVGRALRFGIPLLPHSMAAVAMGSMDRLALGADFPAADVGRYFLALQIASVFTALAAAVNQAWVPWLYARLARNDTAVWTEIARTIRIGGLLLVAGAIGMAALADILVTMVGGMEYAMAVGPLRLLAFYAAFQAWYTLMSAFLFYAERPHLLSMLTVSSAIIQGLLILSCLRWGALGVAAALLMTSALAALAISILAYRSARDHRARSQPAAITV